MESLGVALKKIEDLRRDLLAETVVQELVIDRVEILGESSWNYGMPTGKYYDEVVQERIAEPNTEKREVARKKLEEYNTSEWYSLRYASAIALEFPGVSYTYRYTYHGLGRSKADSKVASWLDELSNRLISQEPETRLKTVTDLITLYRIPHSDGFPIQLSEQLLREKYKTSSDGLVVQKIGEALGYSPLRIWAHEHPVKAAITGIVAAGSASGLVYALAEYFR